MCTLSIHVHAYYMCSGIQGEQFSESQEMELDGCEGAQLGCFVLRQNSHYARKADFKLRLLLLPLFQLQMGTIIPNKWNSVFCFVL